jgi:predicted amino acid-binding ACT domain protein
LFEFKAGFSPRTAKYHVEKEIQDREKHDEMTEEAKRLRSQVNVENEDYFPTCRR